MPNARFAGVPSPRTKPTFRTERFGLWAANSRTNNATGQSPVASGVQASGGAPLRHFSTNGNAYWNLTLNAADATAMSWDKEDYFGLKMYIRPRSVAGRIQVWRKGESGRGGPFFDIVDGKGRFGWWDNDLKKEVYVETSGQVFWPGRVHYVYLRKRWPPQNTTGGNWEDSYWSNNQIRRITMAVAYSPAVGAVVTDTGNRSGTVIRIVNSTTFDVYTTTDATNWGNAGATIAGFGISSVAVPSSDLFIVKRFGASTDASGLAGMTSHDAHINTPVAANGTTINCVPFTSSDAVRVTGVDALGVVSPVGATFTGAINGVITTADMDAVGTEFYVPRPEMVGMYFTWGSGAPVSVRGKVYRITSVSIGVGALGGFASTITCVDPYNLTSLPDFSVVVGAQQGQISTGIQLIKSDGFDTSKSPDGSQNTIYFMGSNDQGQATSTYQPFDGEVWCPGWMVDAPASAGVDALCFENTSAVTNDPTTVGADVFQEPIYVDPATTSFVHQLQYSTGYVSFAWDGRLYNGTWTSPDILASTQPAELPSSAADTIGPTITVSALSPPILGTSKPYWEYVQARGVWSAERYVAVGFRDPVQGINGRPSPVTRIKAIEDDTTNPSGVVRVIVTDIPTGPPGVEVVIYQSAADGNASTLFEAARVPNGTSEVAIELLESLLTLNAAADFDAYEPPRCSLLAAPASRLVYGALEVQPNGMVPSRVAQPGLADFGKLFRLEGGSGERITAMAELDGLFAVFKRRAMGSVTFTTEGFAVVELVSSGVGCVSGQTLQAKDSYLWFLSDRGIQVSQRNGVSNLGRPEYIGEKVKRFFAQGVDLRQLPRASAAINRDRNQYVVALKTTDQTRSNARLSAELESGDVRFARYTGPNVCALATVQSREPGADLLIGGTVEGFVVWMDRKDTGLLMMGPDPGVWGVYQLQSFGAPNSTTRGMTMTQANLIDTDLAGPLGVSARYNDAGGVEREVALLGAEGTLYLHYAEVLLSEIPAETSVMVGAALIHWESAWIDMGNCERDKTLLYVDLVLETTDVQPTGVIYCALYADWNTDDPAPFSTTLDLGATPYRLEPTSLRGRWFKLVVEHAPNTSDVRFDIAALVWRVRDEDQV